MVALRRSRSRKPSASHGVTIAAVVLINVLLGILFWNRQIAFSAGASVATLSGQGVGTFVAPADSVFIRMQMEGFAVEMHVLNVSVDLNQFYEDHGNEFAFDHKREQWAGMSGSLVAIPDMPGHYFHVTRMIQASCENLWAKNPPLADRDCMNPERSVVYARILDGNFRPVSTQYRGLAYPRILDIFEPFKGPCAGPEDARVFLDVHQQINLMFGMLDVDDSRLLWTFNLTSGKLRKLHVEGNPSNLQKNWSPVPFEGKDAFIAAVKQVPGIITCPGRFEPCHAQAGSLDAGTLRGGSPFVNFRGYWVGMPRITAHCGGDCGRIFRPHIVVYSKNLDEMAYVSEAMDFDDALILEPFWNFPTKKESPMCVDAIYTPMTLAPTWIPGVWMAAISVNDQKNFVILLPNLEQFLEERIADFELGMHELRSDSVLVEGMEKQCKLVLRH